MAATLRDTGTGSSSTRDMPDGSINYEGQTITPTEAYTCESIRFYATWGHGDPGTCRVSVQETTAGLPNGSLLTDWATFSVAGAQAKTLRTVTFSTQPDLDIGTKYAIVWDAPSGDPGVKELIIWGQGSSTYAGGNRVYHTGSWVDSPLTEQYFQLWGSDVNPLPGKPTTPTPADEASGINLNATTGEWVSGGDTDSYNISFGTLSGFLTQVATGVTDLSQVLTTGTFGPYNTISYWRVDAVNTVGTTTGDEWYFTTLTFKPVLPTGLSIGSGGAVTGTPSGLNNMFTVRRLVAAAANTIWYEGI